MNRFIKLVKYSFSIHNYLKTYLPQNVTRIHGRIRIDQYSTLKQNQELINQIQTNEKKTYQNQSKKWSHITEEYFNIVNQRYDTRNKSVPQILQKYQYYTKIDWIEDKQYNKIYRRQIGKANEELVLDIMSIPSIKRYWKTAELVKSCFNDDHSIIGFGVDLHNNQNLKFMFRQIKSKKIITQNFNGMRVKNVAFNDSTSIFFLVEDELKRPYQLYFKKLGSIQMTLLYEEKNAEYYLDFHTSKDKSHLIITGSTKVNSQIICIKKNLQHKFILQNLFSKELNSRAFANISNNKFYLWTDLKGAYDYKVCQYNNLTKQYTDFYIPQDGFVLTEVDLFHKYMVLYLRKISKSMIKIIDLQTNQNWDVDINEQVCNIAPGMNEGYKVEQFYFYMSTPFVYNVCYKYNFKLKKSIQMDKHELMGPKFNQEQYKAYVIQAPSETGDFIPITIVQSKKRKGYAKLLLHVYGFYGLQNQVSYNNTYLVALQKDWIIAYAHVRGGNEKGRRWWNEAIQQKKPRAWKDLRECVGHLIKQGYTHPSLLVLYGGSAGAITIWNAINETPHLYKAAVLVYPFLDVLTSLLDQSLALTISDYSQFGNPTKNLSVYNAIESYCPYQTIKTQQYPAIYVQAAKNDYRCQLYQVIKFIKRFRDKAKSQTKIDQLGQKGIIVNIQDDASHQGISDLKQSVKNLCDLFGYLDYVLLEANKDLTYV